MSILRQIAYGPKSAVARIKDGDKTLRHVWCQSTCLSDDEMMELVDCLVEHPNAVQGVVLFNNKLTDKVGVKLARFLAKSTTVKYLGLGNNNFGETTFLAVAMALCVNTSLRELYMTGNSFMIDKERIADAFVGALSHNPDRPTGSVWSILRHTHHEEFQEYRSRVDEYIRAHPPARPPSPPLVRVASPSC